MACSVTVLGQSHMHVTLGQLCKVCMYVYVGEQIKNAMNRMPRPDGVA